jgi:uncharacterized protein YcbK (DUF882 family)
MVRIGIISPRGVRSWRIKMGNLSKHFSRDEFKCPCCGYFHESKPLIEGLEKLRGKIGLPIKVNSGSRCVLHNIQVGGSDRSSHLTGKAADITCRDVKTLLSAALKVFSRVGISANYIHVDVDEDKDQDLFWVYME